MIKVYLISIGFFVTLVSISGFVLTDYYFDKSMKIKLFDECVQVVGSDFSNWITRKETLEYCYGQIETINLSE